MSYDEDWLMSMMYMNYELHIPLDSVVIFATNDDNPEETNDHDRNNTFGNVTLALAVLSTCK